MFPRTTGYFQLTLQDDAGESALVSYQSDTPNQLVDAARS